MAFIFEQSDSEIYASHAGLAVVGPIINRHSGLRKRLKSIPLRHGILHIDLVRTYLGLLCQGKNDFEAVEEVRKDLFFQQALEIGRVPSSARLRQRFDEQAEALTQAADDCIVPMLKNLRATVSALPTGHVALHADVFCLDNSKTRKEGVARTYHGYDGYAPIGAYLGEEGWCVGLELRPGDQHSQKDFLFFLDRVLPRARALAGNRPLLITLDGAHDAAANREYLAREQIDYLIKWNPRKENPNDWKVRAEAEGRFVEVRPGKRVALFDEVVEWSFGERSHRSRRVVQLVERTEDRRGQPLLIPDLVLEGWWTSLDAGSVDAEQVILLYQRRGTSEQFHSEFKSDLDLVRLPSGKFETNALVLALAALAYKHPALHRPEHPHRPRCADPQGAAPAPVAHSDAGDDLPCGSPGAAWAALPAAFWPWRPEIRAAGPLLCPRAGALRRRGFHQNTLDAEGGGKTRPENAASAGFGVSDKERSPFWVEQLASKPVKRAGKTSSRANFAGMV